MKILGLSCGYHDAAAALVINGTPHAMAHEERFSGKKHDAAFPENAINFVLHKAGITTDDLDRVVFYEKPFVKFERIMKTNLSTFPFAPRAFIQSTKSTFTEKVWVRELIARKLTIASEKIRFTEHHLSHAASAFFASPYEEAAIVTIDGVGEWAVTTIGKGTGSTIEIIKELHFPHSIGLLYSAFTAFLGFRVNNGEYKVMGMAPYGKPIYEDKVREVVSIHDDGSCELDMSYFSFHRSTTRTYAKKFEKLFGPPRKANEKFFTRSTGWPAYFGEKPERKEYDALAERQEHYANIAASIQRVTEDAVIKALQEAHRVTKCDALVMAGGVALNSVANGKMLDATPFKSLYTQPAAGDAGGALGAALAVFHAENPGRPHTTMEHAYYGKSYTNEDVESFLKENNITYTQLDDDALIETVSTAIANGKVIGWFHGAAEWGPRALGHRSILADPRKKEMKDILNTKIKFREPYRPFAPSVLAEEAEHFFDIPGGAESYPARFMLLVVPVREAVREKVPAITHVNGTARPQLVLQRYAPRYHALIKKFFTKTGIPMVINTSFNLKGEPIANSPKDAHHTFMRSGIDMLVLENYIIEK